MAYKNISIILNKEIVGKLFLIGLGFLLLGCSQANSERAVDFVDYYAQQQRYFPEQDIQDLQAVSGKKMLVFPVHANAELNLQPELLGQLSAGFEQGLKAYSTFNIQDKKSLASLSELLQLDQAIFLDTFYTTSIADKNISIRLKQTLKVGLFLLPQILTAPCPTCRFKSEGIQLKVALVDVQTGLTIWNSYNNQATVQPSEITAVTEALLKSSALLMYNRYRQHWFEQRNANLVRLAN